MLSVNLCKYLQDTHTCLRRICLEHRCTGLRFRKQEVITPENLAQFVPTMLS